VKLENAQANGIDDLDVQIAGTGLFEGSTFHAGSPGDDEADTRNGLNIARVTFTAPLKLEKLTIPFKVAVDAAWQAAVPVYDLDGLTAGVVFQAKADAAFGLPEVDKSGFKVAFPRDALLGFTVRGRTTLGREADDGNRVLSFQLDDSSEFKFRIPGPIRLAVNSEAAKVPFDIPEQALGTPDAPLVEVNGTLASIKTGSGENGIRIAAACAVAAHSTAPVRVERIVNKEVTAFELEPGTQIAVKTGVSLGFGFGGKDSRIQVEPTSLEWSSNLRNTRLRAARLDFDAPGRISASGKLAVPRAFRIEEDKLLHLDLQAGLRLLDGGSNMALRFDSLPRVSGEIAAGAFLSIHGGDLAGRAARQADEDGHQLSTSGDEGQIAAAWSMRVREPQDSMLSGVVDTKLDLRTRLDFFFPKSDDEPIQTAIRFAGTAAMQRNDPSAPPELNTILLPFKLLGRYQSAPAAPTPAGAAP
jgi:hypothetical protein